MKHRFIITACLISLISLDSLVVGFEVCNCGCKATIKDYGVEVGMVTNCWRYEDQSAYVHGNGIWAFQGLVSQIDVATAMTTRLASYNGCELQCAATQLEIQEAHPNSIAVVFGGNYTIRDCELFDEMEYQRDPENPCTIIPADVGF